MKPLRIVVADQELEDFDRFRYSENLTILQLDVEEDVDKMLNLKHCSLCVGNVDAKKNRKEMPIEI